MFYFSVENKEIEKLLLHQSVSPTLIHFRNLVLESIRQQILQHQINQNCHPMIQILFLSKTMSNITTRNKLSLLWTIGRDSRTAQSFRILVQVRPENKACPLVVYGLAVVVTQKLRFLLTSLLTFCVNT